MKFLKQENEITGMGGSFLGKSSSIASKEIHELEFWEKRTQDQNFGNKTILLEGHSGKSL